jgi:hypothetical protein
VKIRMRVDQTGTRTGEWEPGAHVTREWPPRGSIVELPDDEAEHYCSVGMAEPIATFGEAETATLPPAEERTAVPAEPPTSLRTDTESGQAVRRGPGRPRTQPAAVKGDG